MYATSPYDERLALGAGGACSRPAAAEALGAAGESVASLSPACGPSFGGGLVWLFEPLSSC